jgi:hypothetical protein
MVAEALLVHPSLYLRRRRYKSNCHKSLAIMMNTRITANRKETRLLSLMECTPHEVIDVIAMSFVDEGAGHCRDYEPHLRLAAS